MTLLSILQNGWTAFSLVSLLAGGGGLALILLAFLGTAYLPAFLRRPLIGAGLVLLVGAALFQAGQAKGAHDAFAREAARALAAEQDRTRIARDITDRVSRQAVKDLAAADATNRKLQELKDALDKDPERDRRCTTRDDARRLRAL
jgi:signal transduction histidine kinase